MCAHFHSICPNFKDFCCCRQLGLNLSEACLAKDQRALKRRFNIFPFNILLHLTLSVYCFMYWHTACVFVYIWMGNLRHQFKTSIKWATWMCLKGGGRKNKIFITEKKKLFLREADIKPVPHDMQTDPCACYCPWLHTWLTSNNRYGGIFRPW